MDVDTLLSAAKGAMSSIQQLPTSGIVVLCVPGYMVLVSLLRYRRRDQIQAEFNYPDRESYARMTDDDAFKIIKKISQFEFPFTYLKALQFALFRTYGIPTISSLLVKTAQFSTRENSMKRYADTGVLIAEFVGNPPSSARTHEAIARMNYLHNGYRMSGKILDDDMLYTLSLFAVEPVRWTKEYEWREFTDMEKCALGTFWKSIGDAMEISYEKLPSGKKGFKDGLQWLEEITEWSLAYETKAMVPDITNKETADQTVRVLLWDIPRLMRPLARNMVLFAMDERLRTAMMYPAVGKIYSFIFSSIFSIRKFLLRHFFLPRPFFMPYSRIDKEPSAEARHFISVWEGAPFYVKPTFLRRWGPGAWITWILGNPLPGDEGDAFYPQGYRIGDVGPKKFEGKGQEQVRLARERFEKERKGGCPFAVLN
ncbi:hypothetical protein AJ80_07270 [Polytolypa hystricis UAMH7299]|uniref:ER-bound oxygenase mpaB/mpaB'/Rubber oxygenase catalytic domain-containing protein n=1 Tax=Polytolypa hystricis (strain UAMH7299) TaxID=1447883 RepID=A0A2B7XR15_POLH7|nr:hypothetical protein AJ80_07270 [Polytolypa hystricis UAMH7299]